jgi:AcrR family transcriptional regulator
MRVFWERGYEGSYSDELNAAMGISSSSMSQTFGSKLELYKLCVDRYVEVSRLFFAQTLDEFEDVREAFDALANRIANTFTNVDQPLGCMISVHGLHVASGQSEVSDYTRSARDQIEAMLLARLQRAVVEAQLPAGPIARQLAAFYMSVFHGMAVLARDDRSPSDLELVARMAMHAWPALAQRPDRAS